MATEHTLYVVKRHAGGKDPADPSTDYGFRYLPFALEGPGGAPAPAEAVARHDHVSIDHVRLLQGIDWLMGQDIDVLNISMGPLGRSFAPDDPLQIATRTVTERNIPVIVSAGNRGPDEDTLQALARAPWVISVGATDEQDSLLSTSSRGIPGGPCPTVVACGVADHLEGVPDFSPGTSFAAPRVAGIAAMVQKCLQLILHDLLDIQKNEWQALTKPIRRPIVGIPDSGVNPGALPKRPQGDRLYNGADCVQISRGEGELQWYTKLVGALKNRGIACRMAIEPASVKRAIALLARPLEGYKPHEVGAGLVSSAGARSFLSAFTPTRFIEVFCPECKAFALEQGFAGVDEELGPLWDERKVSVFEELFREGIGLAVARVK
jgi:hypothetical protein